ncbi:MAG TPA: hypothetical protein VM388_12635 [Acidimicrobiales bacterium]|nr:hypothetical protein [Acidimicrobiales bacterium]
MHSLRSVVALLGAGDVAGGRRVLEHGLTALGMDAAVQMTNPREERQ